MLQAKRQAMMSAAQASGQQVGQLALQSPPGQAPPCFYFQQGKCLKGEACPFKHEPVRCLRGRCLAIQGGCRCGAVMHHSCPPCEQVCGLGLAQQQSK